MRRNDSAFVRSLSDVQFFEGYLEDRCADVLVICLCRGKLGHLLCSTPVEDRTR